MWPQIVRWTDVNATLQDARGATYWYRDNRDNDTNDNPDNQEES